MQRLSVKPYILMHHLQQDVSCYEAQTLLSCYGLLFVLLAIVLWQTLQTLTQVQLAMCTPTACLVQVVEDAYAG